MPRCPGQDQRYWKPEDIFDVRCPHCGAEVEFFKDEPVLLCRGCGGEVRNPRIDLGCAKWCKHAAECLGKLPEVAAAILSTPERLLGALASALPGHPALVLRGHEALGRVSAAGPPGGDPQVVRLAVVLGAVMQAAGCFARESSAGPAPVCDGAQRRELLGRAGVRPEVVSAVEAILAALQAGSDREADDFRSVAAILRSGSQGDAS